MLDLATASVLHTWFVESSLGHFCLLHMEVDWETKQVVIGDAKTIACLTFDDNRTVLVKRWHHFDLVDIPTSFWDIRSVFVVANT